MDYYCLRIVISEERAYELLIKKQDKFTTNRTWYYLRHLKTRREVLYFKKGNLRYSAKTVKNQLY